MIEKPENVRIADESDIDPLFWHLVGDLEADNSLDMPVSERKVVRAVRACCTRDNAVAGVIDGPHGPLASIGIQAAGIWFSEQDYLSQVWLFVKPEHRQGTKFYEDLFHFAEWHRQDMSERVGYDLILENTVLSLDRLDAKERLWRRYCGEHIGSIFWTRGAVNGQVQR